MTTVDTNPGFPKSFPLKMIFQNHLMKGDFLTAPWTSPLSHLHPFVPTWVYGCCFPSPYIPGMFRLLQKGDQVQLRAHRTCSSEKGIFVLSEIHQCPIQYVFSWDENARDNVKEPGKWFPQILYSNHLYNTNKYITSDPEILVKYYEGKVCNCEIKERCDYLILQSLYNYH